MWIGCGSLGDFPVVCSIAPSKARPYLASHFLSAAIMASGLDERYLLILLLPEKKHEKMFISSIGILNPKILSLPNNPTCIN
jgi:hypothetical protein